MPTLPHGGVADAAAAGAPPAELGWLTVALPGSPGAAKGPVSWRPLAIQMALAVILVFGLVATAATVAARQTAERESINDALHSTDLLAEAVIQPLLSDSLLSANPRVAAPAVDRLDAVVTSRVISDTLVRVKLWDPQGRVVYSDEPRLIGKHFTLDEDDLRVLRDPSTVSRVSDLSRPENRFERSSGKLLEVYRPVWTASGKPLLFETYSKYELVMTGSTQIWRGFAGITISSLLLMLVLQAPVGWTTVTRLRRAQQQREVLLRRAVTASDEERRRIAATLHDGVVQELAAASFVIAGAAEQARELDDAPLSARLETAAGAVRSSIGGLRSLLVDIYPPSLRASGLAAALSDIAVTLRARGGEITLDVNEDLDLSPDTERLIYAVAQECLRNAERHARASTVHVALCRTADTVVLEVSDDGVGFDPAAVLAEPTEGHVGLWVMRDRAAKAAARLDVSSSRGHGARWRLEVPRHDR